MEDPVKKHFRFRDLDPMRERWDAIASYNRTIESGLPEGARDLALADSHYNATDPRCPHDSWLQSVEITTESSSSEITGIRMKLLGAYHDRTLPLDYSGVREFSVFGQIVLSNGRNQNWLYDEIQLCNSGTVEHLIEFEQFVIRVECCDLHLSFTPITSDPV